MNLGEWKDLVLLVLGFLLSIGAALLGALIQRRVDRRIERRPLNQVLNYGPDGLLFVFPRRDTVPEAILPRTSTEDFLAMNNFISALLSIGWARRIGVRDVGNIIGDMGHLSEADKRQNLVIICSPKSNALAATFQKEICKIYSNVFTFQSDADQVFITDGDGASYRSRSYEQVQNYLSAGVTQGDLPGKQYEDYAVITKVTSPWNEANKIVWLAGIRGIGTWGAAECVKKEWRQIYDRLPPGAKTCDFSALLKVEYDNCDITSVQVRRVELLATKKTI